MLQPLGGIRTTRQQALTLKLSVDLASPCGICHTAFLVLDPQSPSLLTNMLERENPVVSPVPSEDDQGYRIVNGPNRVADA